MVKVLQLTVEVGNCRPKNVNSDQIQDYVLTAELTRELCAATSVKVLEDGMVRFGTKLFIRIDKLPQDNIPKCLIVLTGIDGEGRRSKLACGSFQPKSKGLQWYSLDAMGGRSGGFQVELEFGSCMVEARQPKSINNRSNSFKSILSQKQSSCDQNERNLKKSQSNFHSTGTLQRYDSKDSIETLAKGLKISNNQKIKTIKREDLETSLATSKVQTRLSVTKNQETTTLLSLQIKIDELQEKLTSVGLKLSQCNTQLQQVRVERDKERNKNVRLEMEKEELVELLNLEQLRAKISNQHAIKLAHLLDQLTQQERGIFGQIEQKDEIIFLNQELETQVNTKQLAIDSLKGQIVELKDKIANMELKTPVVSKVQSVSSIKRLQILPGKELEKVKSQKRIYDKKSNWSKKQEDITKETNNSKESGNRKEREIHRNMIKKEREIKVPVKGKGPVNHRNQVGQAVKIPKSGRPSKPNVIKQEQKLAEPQKKSVMQSSLNLLTQQLDTLAPPTNLMLNSRAVQSQRVQTH